MHLDSKRVAVEARALVFRRDVWQAVRSLDLKYPENIHTFSDPRLVHPD